MKGLLIASSLLMLMGLTGCYVAPPPYPAYPAYPVAAPVYGPPPPPPPAYYAAPQVSFGFGFFGRR